MRTNGFNMRKQLWPRFQGFNTKSLLIYIHKYRRQKQSRFNQERKEEIPFFKMGSSRKAFSIFELSIFDTEIVDRIC